MKKFIVFASALLLFSSCVEEQVAPQQENNGQDAISDLDNLNSSLY